MTAPLETVLQGFDVGERVELFDLDFTPIDPAAPVLHLTPFVGQSDILRRGGLPYYPAPMEATGYARGGDAGDRGSASKLPQPTIKVGNASPIVSPYVWGAQGFIGALVTRTVTYRRFLDGEPDEDPTAAQQLDVHEVEQVTEITPTEISFRLVAPIDQAGRELPARRVTRNSCQRRYRTWNGSSFDYSKATCPYVGAGTWNTADQTATDATDNCSRRLTGCLLRFPDGPLPIQAFPGISLSR